MTKAKRYFGEKAIGTCLGTMSESGNVAYIFPSTLNQALTKAGYSPKIGVLILFGVAYYMGRKIVDIKI
jgi:hypothetical protein